MAKKKEATPGGLSARDKRTLLIVLGLVIVVCAYFFIFKSNSDEAATLEESNAGMQTTLDELMAMDANRATTEADTAEKNGKIAEIAANFPSEITEEKMIEIIDDMEKETKVVVSSIGFKMNDIFYPDSLALGTSEEPIEVIVPVEGEEFKIDVQKLVGYRCPVS